MAQNQPFTKIRNSVEVDNSFGAFIF